MVLLWASLNCMVPLFWDGTRERDNDLWLYQHWGGQMKIPSPQVSKQQEQHLHHRGCKAHWLSWRAHYDASRKSLASGSRCSFFSSQSFGDLGFSFHSTWLKHKTREKKRVGECVCKFRLRVDTLELGVKESFYKQILGVYFRSNFVSVFSRHGSFSKVVPFHYINFFYWIEILSSNLFLHGLYGR